MEVKELLAALLLNVFRIGVVGGVGGPDNSVKQLHPPARHHLNLRADFVVHGLPKELYAEVYKLWIVALRDQLQQVGQGSLQKSEKVSSFLLSDAELKASSDGEEHVKERD